MDPKRVLDAYRLDGKTALVTGASRGLGRAMALGLAGAGADVALVGRERATLEPVAREIERELGRKALCVPLDVADIDAIRPAVDGVIRQLGQIDILVNNAGMNIRNNTLDFTPEEWDQVLDTNLKGTFFLTQHVGRHMIESGGGKILNIGSMTAFLGVPTVPAYTASKAALQQLTRLLAVEWADHNIQVNAIAPGWISTDLTNPLKTRPDLQPRYQWVVSRTPMGRFGEPDELVGAAVFLCSPAADFITGQVLAVDGGIVAGSDWRKGAGGG
jgi:NAD(P)-dependent dehydrogenase (short-subunit alcohol dehydrogenase family)